MSACHVNLGGLCVIEGDPTAGADHLRRALEFTEYIQDPKFGCAVRNNYGCAPLHLGRLEELQRAGAMDMLGSALCHHDLEQARLHWERAVRVQRNESQA